MIINKLHHECQYQSVLIIKESPLHSIKAHVTQGLLSAVTMAHQQGSGKQKVLDRGLKIFEINWLFFYRHTKWCSAHRPAAGIGHV
jgi:hypothetical protein